MHGGNLLPGENLSRPPFTDTSPLCHDSSRPGLTLRLLFTAQVTCTCTLADHVCTRVCAHVCVTRGGCSPGLAGAFLLRVSRSRSFPSRQPRTMQAPRGPCTWPMTPSTGRTLSGAPHASPTPPLPVGGEHDGIGTPGNGVFFTAFPAPGIVFLTWLLILPGAGDA